jgi:hypothetical protein
MVNKIVAALLWAIRSARRLFHLVVSLAFLVLSAAGASVAYGEWRIYQRAPAAGPVRFWVVVGFTGLLVILGLYSFAKARSVR